MIIKILGTGCPNCLRLEGLTNEVVKEMGVEADFEKVQDIPGILSYGIMSTPGLVINEKVKSFGKIPSKSEIKNYIEEEL